MSFSGAKKSRRISATLPDRAESIRKAKDPTTDTFAAGNGEPSVPSKKHVDGDAPDTPITLPNFLRTVSGRSPGKGRSVWTPSASDSATLTSEGASRFNRGSNQQNGILNELSRLFLGRMSLRRKRRESEVNRPKIMRWLEGAPASKNSTLGDERLQDDLPEGDGVNSHAPKNIPVKDSACRYELPGTSVPVELPSLYSTNPKQYSRNLSAVPGTAAPVSARGSRGENFSGSAACSPTFSDTVRSESAGLPDLELLPDTLDCQETPVPVITENNMDSADVSNTPDDLDSTDLSNTLGLRAALPTAAQASIDPPDTPISEIEIYDSAMFEEPGPGEYETYSEVRRQYHNRFTKGFTADEHRRMSRPEHHHEKSFLSNNGMSSPRFNTSGVGRSSSNPSSISRRPSSGQGSSSKSNNIKLAPRSKELPQLEPIIPEMEMSTLNERPSIIGWEHLRPNTARTTWQSIHQKIQLEDIFSGDFQDVEVMGKMFDLVKIRWKCVGTRI